MTAEPRDVEEIRALYGLHGSSGCKAVLRGDELGDFYECSCGWRSDTGTGVAIARTRLAAADRENAELRGEVERLRESQFAVGQALVNEQLDSDRARAQLAAAQAQLAEAREVGDLNGQEADNLLARAEAAEARLEAVRAVPLQPDSTPDGVRQNSYSRGWTDAVNAVRAALSAAPQPEPGPESGCACGHTCDHGPHEQELDHDPEWTQAKADLGRSLAETFAEHTRARGQVPPASDEPARCVHGWTRRHVMVSSQSTSVAGLPDATTCPGPTAPTPTPECRHCGGSGNAHTFDGADLGICGTCHGTGSAAGGGL